MNLLPIRTISIQKIDNDNNKFNQFSVVRDIIFSDGTLHYESSDDLDDSMLKILRTGTFPLEIPIKRDGFECYNLNKCVYDDDFVNLQLMQKSVAEQIPQGFIHFKSDKEIQISTFMPSR